MFKKRRIAKLITLIMAGVIVILPIVPTAFAVDPDETTVYYESESNDTYSTADRTYDDYDNYGKISSEGDVDWWYIVVTADGMANFWLGQIPTGCNYNMTLYKGNGTSAIVSSNNAIDTYSASALSEVELVIFSGCKTGITSERYGNLVDAVIAKGAKCAIGWTESTYTSDSNRWVGKFFEYCSQGYNLHIARSLTNSWIRNNSPEDGDAIVSQYVGTSPMSNTILGLQY